MINSIPKTEARQVDIDSEIDYIKQVAEEMKSFIVKKKVLGVAAPLLGHPVAMLAFGDPKTPESIKVAINPKIPFVKDEFEYLNESSLCFPNYSVKVKRSKQIRVRYINEQGLIETHTYVGMTARIFQHEYDHLIGKTIKDRATYYHKSKAEKLKRKLDTAPAV